MPTKLIKRTKAMPVWAKWVATDKDGERYAFNLKPTPCGDFWVAFSPRAQDPPQLWAPLRDVAMPRDWKSTLRRIV